MRVQSRLAPAALSCLLLFAPRVARADEFSEFRIPDHRVYGASADLTGTWHRYRSDQPPGASTGISDQRSGGMQGTGYWWRDSERGFTNFSANAYLNGSRSTREERSDGYTAIPFASHQFSATDDLYRDLRETLLLAAQWRRYPWSRPVAMELTGSVASSFRQSWVRSAIDQRYEDPGITTSTLSTDNGDIRTRALVLSASVAVGYGRVRDASGVYAARTLERRLRELGVLKRPLSTAGAGKLATLFYLQSSVGSVHDRPDKFFWREVERVLREDGALGEQALDAYSLLRLLEPFVPPERIRLPYPSLFLRRSGYFAGLVITDQRQHSVGRQSYHYHLVQGVDSIPPSITDYSSSSEQKLDDNLVLVGPEAEVHRPIGMRWQVDAAASAGYAILRNAKVDESFVLNSSASATFQVADRWLWTAQSAVYRQYLRSPRDQPDQSMGIWQTVLGSSVSYYLEDHVVLGLAVLEQQAMTSGAPAGPYGGRTYSRQDRVEFGVSYRFLGALDAPGVIAPMRLAPPGN